MKPHTATQTTRTRSLDSFRTRQTLQVAGTAWEIFSLRALQRAGFSGLARLPYSLRVMLENLLRHEDGRAVKEADIEALAGWRATERPTREIEFTPARVLLQDFTGVPAVVDLAVMRDAIARLGGDPQLINPLEPVDLVIDHSVQVDAFGAAAALARNAELEHERNRERYEFLRWGQTAFDNFHVVPPDTGIVHQVNLEYLARVVFATERDGTRSAYPDTLVGTDSHTTMINGLGVVGWGVGGIEAEAAMLGQPLSLLIPQVVGVRLTGQLPPGATATDLVLRITQMLRRHGVVGKFVEYCGKGLDVLSVADRATIANMSPEYGATMGFFPVDEETLRYLTLTGRSPEQVALVEAYCREQGLLRMADSPEPIFSELLTLDLATVEPSVAGPRRPQDRVALHETQASFRQWLGSVTDDTEEAGTPVVMDGTTFPLRHGSVVIAAITSCTNTSNPSVMLAAGLLARNAVHRGLSTRPWVKTSLAPGSKVVTDYLSAGGLTPYLEALRFHTVGYGCTTCIGNSGPLPEAIARAVQEHHLCVAAVLSGNRNFEGRINSLVRANYLASPPLVVAYALAGTVDVDFEREPLGHDPNGEPVFLRDVWPAPAEVAAAVEQAMHSEMFTRAYRDIFSGDDAWRALPTPTGNRYAWQADSTYIKPAPFFDDLQLIPTPLTDIQDARILALLGDSITTDHISPAGSIAPDSPAGRYLRGLGVEPRDFNSYGARRGNHEVMVRGTFANVRLRNQLAPGTEGPWTTHLAAGAATGERMTIFDAAQRYAQEGVPLVVIAGAEYGTGSSRDWAAKGPRLLGVRAVIAKSFERIHRSNLVGMGILPLQFDEGQDAGTLRLTGAETCTVMGIANGVTAGSRLQVRAKSASGNEIVFPVTARLDTANEVDYYSHGGILPCVLRSMIGSSSDS